MLGGVAIDEGANSLETVGADRGGERHHDQRGEGGPPHGSGPERISETSGLLHAECTY